MRVTDIAMSTVGGIVTFRYTIELGDDVHDFFAQVEAGVESGVARAFEAFQAELIGEAKRGLQRWVAE